MPTDDGPRPPRGKCKYCEAWVTWAAVVTVRGKTKLPFDEMPLFTLAPAGEDEQGRPQWEARERVGMYRKHACPKRAAGPVSGKSSNHDDLPF